MRTLQQVQFAYSRTVQGDALVSLEDMEALAGALLHEHPYTPEDIQSRVSVSQLTDLFEGDDSSSAGAVSIQVRNRGSELCR